MDGGCDLFTFIHSRRLYEVPPERRTHTYRKFPASKPIEVTDAAEEGFLNALAEDLGSAQPPRQEVRERLSDSFVFFVDVCCLEVQTEGVALRCGQLMTGVVAEFLTPPTSVCVLEWRGSRTDRMLRLRYIFEGVVVNCMRAFVMHNAIRAKMTSSLPPEDAQALHAGGPAVEAAEPRTAWLRVLPDDAYRDGKVDLLMMGSHVLEKCTFTTSTHHDQCPHCKGTRVVARNPHCLQLKLLLDGAGVETAATISELDKLTMHDRVRRTRIRRSASEPLSQWQVPPSCPAIALDTKSGSVAPAVAFAGEKANESRVVVPPSQRTVLDALQVAIRRQRREWAELLVMRAMRCDSKTNGTHYLVFVEGSGDRYCMNISGYHDLCPTEAHNGRIAFCVYAEGVRQICYCKRPVGDGLTPCRRYKQVLDRKNELTNEEILALGFRPTARSATIVGGTTANQLQFTVLPELQRQINGEPKRGPKGPNKRPKR